MLSNYSQNPLRGNRSRCAAVAALVLFISASSARAQWRDVWLTQTDSGQNATEVDFDIEIDGDGNVVTVGFVVNPDTNEDMLLRKYDRTGRLLWTQVYDSGGSEYDYFGDLIIDSNNNIITSGTGVNANGDADIVTLKYTPDGQLDWAIHYDGPFNGRDESFGWPSIDLDSDENVYVCGYSQALDGVLEFAVIKYNPAGNELWVQKYRGPNTQNANSYGHALAVTPAGDVYMGGNARNLNGDADYVLLKYDTAGNLLWERLFDSQYHGGESLYTLAIDNNENVFVSGISDSQFLNNDFEYCTVKYDSNGNFQWEGRYGGDYGFHYGWVSEVDDNGGVYVTGASMSSGGQYDIATVHFDANGATDWVQRFSNPRYFASDWGYGIRRDNDGNVLVAGFGWNGYGQGDNGYLLKYSPTGVLLDSVNYDSDVHGDDWFTAVAVDDAGRAIVCGVSLGIGTGADSVAAKYTTAPTPELVISPDPPVAGQTATFTVTDMEPLSDCYLGYSVLGPGNVYVPFLNVALDLQQPQEAGGVKVSDQSGTAVWQLPIPGNASGVNVWFQAAQYNQVSNVVATQVQ